MDKEDEILMAKYGIVITTKTFYQYNNHVYEKLSDALNYAKIEADRNSARLTETTAERKLLW